MGANAVTSEFSTPYASASFISDFVFVCEIHVAPFLTELWSSFFPHDPVCGELWGSKDPLLMAWIKKKVERVAKDKCELHTQCKDMEESGLAIKKEMDCSVLPQIQ